MNVWKDLWPLRKNKRVGIEQITFGLLWEAVGGRPGKIAARAKLLGEQFSRDGSTLRTHLEKLARIGIIRLIARDKKIGDFLIEVYNPCPDHAEVKPDPQMTLPGFWTEGVDDLGRLIESESPMNLAGDANISGGDAEGATRGNFPATRELSRQTGTFPRETSREPGLEKNPEAQNIEKSAENAQDQERGKVPAPESARGLHHSNDNDSKDIYPQNGAMKSNGNVSNVVIHASEKRRRESSRGKVPATTDAEALDAEISRRRVGEESRQLGRAASFSDSDICSAILTERSLPQQKLKLIQRMRNLVRDPETGNWLFGFAADLMLQYGQGQREDAGVVYGKMNQLLQDIQGYREIEQRKGTTPRPCGQWFNSEVHKICSDHNILTPSQRKRQKAMATA